MSTRVNADSHSSPERSNPLRPNAQLLNPSPAVTPPRPTALVGEALTSVRATSCAVTRRWVWVDDTVGPHRRLDVEPPPLGSRSARTRSESIRARFLRRERLGSHIQVLPVAAASVGCSLARNRLLRPLPDPFGVRRATSLPSGTGTPSTLESHRAFALRAATPRSGLATRRDASDTRFTRCAAR